MVALKNMRNKKKIIIGVTGGVATGKSFVAGIFKQYGAAGIDADRIARMILRKGLPAYREVVGRFGKEILLPSGGINREKLGALIFTRPDNRRTLNRITHHRIIHEIKKKIRALNHMLIVVDAPLLFEAKLEQGMDFVVVVWTTRTLQIERLMRRNRLNRADACRMIDSQIPLKEKIRKADFIVRNTGSYRSTARQVADCMSKLVQ